MWSNNGNSVTLQESDFADFSMDEFAYLSKSVGYNNIVMVET